MFQSTLYSVVGVVLYLLCGALTVCVLNKLGKRICKIPPEHKIETLIENPYIILLLPIRWFLGLPKFTWERPEEVRTMHITFFWLWWSAPIEFVGGCLAIPVVILFRLFRWICIQACSVVTKVCTELPQHFVCE